MHTIETSHALQRQELAERHMEWVNRKIKKDNLHTDLVNENYLLKLENSYLKEVSKKDAEIIEVLERTIKILGGN